MAAAQFIPYSPVLLPAGFKYPAALLDVATGPQAPNLSPWEFLDASSKVGQLAYSVRRSDGRNLVPFASVEDDRKDIACFDGDDGLGNPAVLMLILDGSGRAYGYADFDDWLRAARLDAARWSG